MVKYCGNHTKQINRKCGKTESFFNVTACGTCSKGVITSSGQAVPETSVTKHQTAPLKFPD